MILSERVVLSGDEITPSPQKSVAMQISNIESFRVLFCVLPMTLGNWESGMVYHVLHKGR